MDLAEFEHNVRNGTMGIFAERKKLLKELMVLSSVVEQLDLRPLEKYITRQMACLERMDEHLNRVMEACKHG